MFKFFTIIITLIFCGLSLSQAQEITLYSSDNSDLFYNPVYCIDFDGDGNIWFGGQINSASGLARVSMLATDLTTWTVWEPADLALTDLEERVFYMAKDDVGTMWFCTHYGVSYRKSDGTAAVVDFTKDKYTRSVETNSKGTVYISIREDNRSDSRIWFSSDHGATWDTLGLKTMDFSLGYADARPEIYDLREDSQGQLWICTWYGITYQGTDGNWNLIAETEDLYTFAMTIDPNDHLWVPISGAYQLYEIKPDATINVYDASAIDILSYAINDLEADENGFLWLATDGAGLVKLNPADGSYTSWDSASTQGQIPQNNLTHLEINDGVIWASTADEGILRIDGLIETAIDHAMEEAIVKEFCLHNNYPNPFNPVTTIGFELPVNSNINLSIYNLQGQLIKTIAQGNHPAGTHQYSWNGSASNGQQVASGVYVYNLSAPDFTQSKKMIYVK